MTEPDDSGRADGTTSDEGPPGPVTALQGVDRFESADAFVEINDLEVVEREIVRLMLIYGQHPLFELTNEDNIVTRELTVEEYLVQEIQRDELEFTNPAYRQIFEAFQHFVNNAQLVDNKYFINHPEVLISKTTVDLISQKYELSKMYTKKEVFLETEDMKLKTTVPELALTYKTKRIKLMIKQVQVKLLEAQKNNETEELLNLQQQLMLLFSLYGEAAKGLGNRVIV